ncbi:MAG: type II toxin-antitoxin system PemK/MazF family toxin [Anaerolineales bacterium]|nr:type II toxin-antitoxin system PemK/MazF family toxin [Anaerolineales bacterium]
MTTMTQTKLNYHRGDVVLVLFPHSDLRTAKTRPTLIVQADDLDTGLHQIIVAMITSRIDRGNHPSRVTIKLSTNEGKNSGLLTDSVVLTDNLATIADFAVDRNIGNIPMDKIDEALRHSLGLSQD